MVNEVVRGGGNGSPWKMGTFYFESKARMVAVRIKAGGIGKKEREREIKREKHFQA